MRAQKYWIIVASKDHVEQGIAEGIAQACHGKSSPLLRMQKGDYVIYYSAKEQFGETVKCQQFTAIGQVKDDQVYQYQLQEDFCPHRRNIEFIPNKDISILPLIDQLHFIRNKKNWGYPFRWGILEIDKHDFELISKEMTEPIHEYSC
ncbi:MAG: EVE domain-containing protein [Calditrichaceae bacterium]